MDELRFKLLLIRKVLLLKPELIATEVPFFSGKRRADVIALWKGNSHAFEIKSDKDSAAKLLPQLNDYCATFDFVTVVLSERLVKANLEKIPRKVGVVSVCNGSSMKVIRRARKCKRLNKEILALSLDKAILSDLVGAFPNERRSYQKSIERAKGLTVASLSNELKRQWQKKYSRSYELFLDEIGKKIYEDDLLNFTRHLDLRLGYSK